MITGIVVALPEELITLTSKRIDKGHCVFIGDRLLVTCSGTGAQNAQSSAELLVAKGATQLISWGCAAALEPSLKSGDLTLADRLLDADDNEIAVSPDWHRYTKNLLSGDPARTSPSLPSPENRQAIDIQTGLLAESKTLVSSSQEKKQLHSTTSAIALDMESVAIAKIAHRHKLPFLAIRAIADPANMDLPKAVAYAMNDQGDIILGRLLLFLALHPLELPGLIKLGLHFNKAKRSLKRAAGHLDSIAVFNSPPWH